MTGGGGEEFLLGFRMGRMKPFFQMKGMQLLVNEKLKSSVTSFYDMGSQMFQVYVGDVI